MINFKKHNSPLGTLNIGKITDPIEISGILVSIIFKWKERRRIIALKPYVIKNHLEYLEKGIIKDSTYLLVFIRREESPKNTKVYKFTEITGNYVKYHGELYWITEKLADVQEFRLINP